jgi:hypothetical protein
MTIASNLSFLQNSAGAITTGTVNAIGSPITFSVNNTEYNRIDTNGYSLLGYTASQGSYKLQVNGNVLINGTLSLTTASIGNITGSVTTASNIAGGTTGQLHYQTGVGLTGFVGPGTAGQLLVSAGASAPVYTNTASIYVNSARYSDNITAGTTGQLVYQSAANTTAFVGPGTSGQILVSAGASAPVYTTTSSIQVGYSANILAGTAGQLVYQSAANTTGFVGPGTAGQFLQSAGTSAPTYVSTTTMYVQRAVQADSAAGASGSTTGALTAGTGLTSSGGTFNGSTNLTFSLNTATLMASAVQVSNSISAGTGLSGSAFNGSTAQTWTLNTATLMASSVNLAGGTAGQLHYQSAANTTGFVGPGTAGQFLQSAGTSAPTYVSTTTMYVQRAVQADSAAGGSAQVNTQAQPANATYYPAFVSANNASATAMSVYTTGTFIINPATGQVGVNTTFLSTSSKLVVSGRVESITDPAGEGGQFVMRSPGFGYRWSIDNYYGAFRIIREDDVTEGSGASILTITSGTNSIMVIGGTTGYSGEKFAVNGGTYHNGITTMTNSLYVTGGNVGIGQSSAVAKLDVAGTIRTEFFGTDTSSPVDVMNITGNGVARALGTGATLTFTAPANTDGTNMWAQARIIGGGDNNSNGDANGAMMLQTRSLYVPSGGSGSWNWRTGITIRASGAIAFGNGGTAYGSSGQVLQSNGNASPSWVSPSSLAAASATQVSTQAQPASGTYYPVFVSANNASATAMSEYTTSTFTINPATGAVGVNGIGGTALNINVTSSNADKYFLTCTGAVNSFSVYENSNTAYLNSYANMTLRANQNGGSGGLINLTGGNVYVANSLGVGTNSPSYKLTVAGANTTSSPLAQFNATGSGAFQRGVQLFNTSMSAGDSIMYCVGTADSSRQMGQMYYYYAGSNSTSNRLSFGLHSVDDVINILGSGNVMIGTTTDNGSKLGVNGGANISGSLVLTSTNPISLQGNSNSGTYNQTVVYSNQNNTSGSNANGIFIERGRLTDSSSAEVRYLTIGSRGGQAQFTFDGSGNFNATAEITAYSSDKRLKTNVQPIDNAVSKVLKLTGITYTWNELANKLVGYNTEKRVAGLFAQDVEEVLPEAVKLAPFDTGDQGESKSGENYKTVQYEKLVPLLVEAIKEQQQQITQLRELVNQLVNK